MGGAILAGLMAMGGRAQGAPATPPATQPATRSAAPVTQPTPAAKPATKSSAPAGRPTATAPSSSLTPATSAGDSELALFSDIPVVVAAGKREQTLQKVAASASIVTADDIELFGYRSLADVLRGQRGFYTYTDGLNWFAGVRGFLRPGEWNARITVLVDGRPTRDMIYSQTHLDEDFVVPMEAVKRVEVIRGPGSALYGGNAVFGVIGVVTKDGADINGVDVHAQGGTLNTVRLNTLFGFGGQGDWDVMGDFSGFSTAGDENLNYPGVNDALHNFGRIEDHDHEQAGSAFFKARNGDLTFELDYEARDKGNRSATYLTSFTDPGSMYEQRTNFTVKYDHELAEGQSIHAMAYFGRYAYSQWYGLFDSTNNNAPFTYYTQSYDDWLGEEVHYDWQVNKTVHLLLGADANQALDTRQYDHDTLQGSVLDARPSYNAWGLFAEGQWDATPWLSFVAGARLDYVQRSGQRVSPRFAAIISPDRSDAIKLLYGRAFRAPNLYEQFYASPGSNTPNPRLHPEVVDTYELVWERECGAGCGTVLDTYMWEMAHTMDNVTLSDGSLETENGARSKAYGIEAEVQKKWDNGARLRAYSTLTLAQQADADLQHSPQWTVGTSLAFPLINKNTFLAIEPVIVGPMKSDNQQYNNPSFVTNIILTSRHVTKSLDVQAGVYNLFSKYSKLPNEGMAFQAQSQLDYPGTLFMAGFTYHF